LQAVVEFGARDLTIGEIWDLAQGQARAALATDPAVAARIARSAGHVEALLARDGAIYGVTTGYGDSCTSTVPAELVAELPLQLSRFHGCGLGRLLTPEETRAVLAVRLATLVRGWSGVSLALVERLVDLLRLDILPLIPAEGSVGASGDLTPLSYVAGALAGERPVRHAGAAKLAAEAFAAEGLAPLRLRPKEALAIMNGTAVMTGLAVLVYRQAEHLAALATRLTALASLALLGNPRHFDPRLSAAKPHPGQGRVAARLAADLAAFAAAHAPDRLQDRYSIRCAPHVIGVLEDAAPGLRAMIEIEINSANDNPLFDPETGDVLHGGHFYGGHICHAMDSLKILVANLADLMDRQAALLVDPRYSNGLPANLSGAQGPRAAINHGLKAVQIAISAWTAEAQKQAMPASLFSRSTECHNQDKVSQGTIAARDALRVNELTAQCAAAHLLACIQAVRLRLRAGELERVWLGPGLAGFLQAVDEAVPFVAEDRPLDRPLAQLTAAILAGRHRPIWDPLA
jgi:histidine ammonia-lyase